MDLQLLRNGSLNREQVSMLRAAWDGSDRRCAADYGNSTWCAVQQQHAAILVALASLTHIEHRGAGCFAAAVGSHSFAKAQ